MTDTLTERHAPRLVGWQPSSMLDWPGRVVATVFLGGCSYRCPYCHNPDLRHPPELPVASEDLDAFLVGRRTWLDGVVVTGGEPTLDPALPDLLAEIRSLGMAVKLDTNGSRPDVLRRLIDDGLINAIAVDVKALPHRYVSVTGDPDAARTIERTIQLVVEAGIDHEFRTTVYPDAVHLDDLERIARWLTGARRLVLQQFNPAVTLDPRARDVVPYTSAELLAAASRCSRHVPTTVRGA